MPTKALDRLMFAQGGKCFSCNAILPKAEASVEHLVASARAGSNSDDNCVACCKAVNSLFGSMSLKEKIQVVLNQKGNFRCPNGIGSQSGPPVQAKSQQKKVASAPVASPAKKPNPVGSAGKSQDEVLAEIVGNLKSRGNSRPRHLVSLKAALKASAGYKFSDAQVTDLVRRLQLAGKITVENELVIYSL